MVKSFSGKAAVGLDMGIIFDCDFLSAYDASCEARLYSVVRFANDTVISDAAAFGFSPCELQKEGCEL